MSCGHYNLGLPFFLTITLGVKNVVAGRDIFEDEVAGGVADGKERGVHHNHVGLHVLMNFAIELDVAFFIEKHGWNRKFVFLVAANVEALGS